MYYKLINYDAFPLSYFVRSFVCPGGEKPDWFNVTTKQDHEVCKKSHKEKYKN